MILVDRARRNAKACKGCDGYDPSSLLNELADRIDHLETECVRRSLIIDDQDERLVEMACEVQIDQATIAEAVDALRPFMLAAPQTRRHSVLWKTDVSTGQWRRAAEVVARYDKEKK